MGEFVSNGGRYLGTCMGAYLVGNDSDFPGYDFGLNVSQYIDLPDATVSSEDDSIIQLLWRGKDRDMYFQDGPYFTQDSSVKS